LAVDGDISLWERLPAAIEIAGEVFLKDPAELTGNLDLGGWESGLQSPPTGSG